MKRVWIVVGLVVVILGTGIAALYHLAGVTREMEASLDAIGAALEEEDREALVRLSQSFEAQWEENEASMKRYVHHDELDAITGTVARLSALSHYGAFPELAAETARLHHLVRHIYESELPILENIV